MKYITTGKHPELKEGVIISQDFKGDNFYKIKASTFCTSFYSEQIDRLIEKGYIKELQEPEFTKDDMIEFAFWVLSEQDNYEKETIKLDDWLNQRNR